MVIDIRPMLINGVFGCLTGAGAALIGYIGNSKTEEFKLSKALPTVLTGLIAGAIAGLISPDVRSAIIAALGGDVVRKATKNYIVNS